jgi:hypothetical protein
MTIPIRQIAERLAANAEAVCRHYLDNGRKSGRHWIVGDAYNAKGRSMFVRLTGPTYGPGAAGKWTDGATGEHGDLLDIIALSLNINPAEAREEALRFLSLPTTARKPDQQPVPPNSRPAARRLFAASVPLPKTPGETYLRKTRAITCSLAVPSLRFHPRCYLMTDAGRVELPAIIAAITDNAGDITGVQRLFLAPGGIDKAAIAEPKRSLGEVLGNAIRIGEAHDVMAVGEGLETMLSNRSLLPAMPVAACTSANHLAVFIPPLALKRLYIAHDHGRAGVAAADKLAATATGNGIDVRLFTPPGDDDWNSALRGMPKADLLAALAGQLAPEDVLRFAPLAEAR